MGRVFPLIAKISRPKLAGLSAPEVFRLLDRCRERLAVNIRPLKKIYPPLLIAVNLAVAALTFTCFYSSPYTGIRAELRGKQPFVREVDKDGPADRAGIKAGDLLVGIDNTDVPYQAFSEDPDLLPSKKEQRVFWEGRKKLNHALVKGRPALFQVKREDGLIRVSMVPSDFPLLRIAGRLWFFYACGFVYVAVTYLVLRKKENEISHALFLLGSFFSILILTGANVMSDLSHPAQLHRALMIANHIALFASTFPFAHLVLVFPRRKAMLAKRPWIIPGIYCAMAASLVLDFAPFIDNSKLTAFFAVFLVLVLSGGMLIAAFIREKDLVVRKQIQWVVAGFAVYGLWGGINVLFWASGGDIPPEAVILPMIAVPVCWAVAVTKFRLMDIDDLFDHAVIFAVTIAVLQALELLFLGLVSPHVPLMQRAPYLSLSAMLLIVFLYLPVRTRVKTGVERLFKRNIYEADEELRKFIIGLSGRDTASILDGFLSFAGDLLGPSGAGVIQFRNNVSAAAQTRGEGARGAMNCVLSGAGALRAHIGLNREAVFGYELADKGVLGHSPSFPDSGGSLFIPVLIGAECAYIIVLLPKWNSSPYTRKDRRLLQSAATSMAHALEAEKRRGELEEERLRLAREIHDGISSEFTAILAYGERGARFLDEASSPEAARDFFTKIVEASRRGIRELRNIIWALNAENHSLQFLSSYIKRYVSDLLNVNGISVTVKEGDQKKDALLPPPVFLALFRTVQELCQNVLKHAAADSVTIDLRESHGRIVLSFADNGRGLPPGSTRRVKGYGLNNIRKRMEDLGGAVEVTSAPNKGTIVEIRAPLA